MSLQQRIEAIRKQPHLEQAHIRVGSTIYNPDGSRSTYPSIASAKRQSRILQSSGNKVRVLDD